MELKDLRIFHSVAKEGSISRAAKSLNFVQSHVTARIKVLESELDTQLFLRHSRGTSLTSEGKKLQLYSNRILDLMDEMNRAFHDTEKPSGSLHLGTVETIVRLPDILSTFQRGYPDVSLSLTTGVTMGIMQKIVEKQLDGAFVADFKHHPEINRMELFRETLVLVSSESGVMLDDLKRKPMLVFKEGCSYRANLDRWLKDEEVRTRLLEFGTLETIIGSVRRGLGISLVPKSAVQTFIQTGEIHAYDIPETYSSISTDFIWHKDAYLTHSMDRFLQTIQAFKEKSGQ